VSPGDMEPLSVTSWERDPFPSCLNGLHLTCLSLSSSCQQQPAQSYRVAVNNSPDSSCSGSVLLKKSHVSKQSLGDSECLGCMNKVTDRVYLVEAPYEWWTLAVIGEIVDLTQV
jgi:hypothetical protein